MATGGTEDNTGLEGVEMDVTSLEEAKPNSNFSGSLYHLTVNGTKVPLKWTGKSTTVLNST